MIYLQKSVYTDTVQQHIEGLINSTTRGLYPGSPEYDNAVKYIVSQFQASGIQPAGQEFIQKFSFTSKTLSSEPIVMVNNETPLILGKDFIIPLTSGSAFIENIPMVFIGYGISEPQDKYDEYSNIDVKNKVVVVIREIPSGFITNTAKYQNLYYRAYLAKNYGASGIIFVDLNAPTAYFSQNASYVPPTYGISDFPQCIVSKQGLQSLLPNQTFDLLELQNDIVKSKYPYTIDLKTSITMMINLTIKREHSVNVIGYLPAAQEYAQTKKRIYFTASLDSFGKQPPSLFYESANSSVSGTIALLALAKNLAKVPNKRMNDIYFVVFSCKEEGLLGGKDLLDRGEITVDNTLFMVQLENLGLNSPVITIGGGLDYLDLYQKIEENNPFPNLDLTVAHGGYMEDILFIKKGIPALYIYTPNFTIYRTLNDTKKTIIPASINRSVQLLFSAFFYDIFSAQ